MDYLLLIYLITIIPFAIIGIKSDIEIRKIKNHISLPFLYISVLFLVFFSFSQYFGFWEWLCVFLALLTSFILHHIKFWGGGDAKIFLALSFFIISYGFALSYLDFLINLTILYTITFMILIIFLTPNNKKIKVLKSIDYGLQLFQLLVIYIFIRNIFLFFQSFNEYLSVLLILVMLIISLKYIFPFLKKFYTNIKNSDLKFLLNLALFFIMIYMSDLKHIYYFFLILALKIIIDFSSNMTKFIAYNKEGIEYHSPFLVHLFTAAIFTLLAFNNIIDIILKFVL